MSMSNFTVAREHLGDRMTEAGIVPHRYTIGETREADPAKVKALVAAGILIAPPEAEAAPVDPAAPEVPAPAAAKPKAARKPAKG